ncbi:hypothetical protein IFM89_028271 [Coptis chinensis]|uniref:Small ubiquitin-related modifier n=1 Tax=Coptis chinensis TaxID=261450 RepID=A0A835HHT4_9MAGN|nr:hypothetical protein IFM89_028271 [Coptis chinensis]
MNKENENHKNQSSHVNVKINSQDGNQLHFRIRRDIPLKNLMKVYCEQQCLEIEAIAFLFDGRYIKKGKTPDELQMKDDDEIDAMLHQTSGSPANYVGQFRELNWKGGRERKGRAN